MTIPGSGVNTTIFDILGTVKIGSSVAEDDNNLVNYFLATNSFRRVITGEKDIIAGDKGSGKSAIFKILHENQGAYKELNNIDILPAFNVVGNPIFNRLVTIADPSEGECVVVWKCYFLSIVGNWLLNSVEGSETDAMKALELSLKKMGLYDTKIEHVGWFGRVCDWFSSSRIKDAGIEFGFSNTGTPTVTPKITLEESRQKDQIEKNTETDKLLRYLNDCLIEASANVWIILDRLDEAFHGYPKIELPALRALMQAYLEMKGFDRIKIKLFVRNDLFKKVTSGGFVNLTHVTSNMMKISWEDKDLISMITKRLLQNKSIKHLFSTHPPTSVEVMKKFLPPKVDSGEKKPESINWILNRIIDGNKIKSPRNMIDLFAFTIEFQCKSEERKAREYQVDSVLFESDALKLAFKQLSETRFIDTLISENPEVDVYLKKFKDGKAHHNKESISTQTGYPVDKIDELINSLVTIGFLEEKNGTYKIPLLYQKGSGVSWGKAFTESTSSPSEDEDE